MTPALGRSRSGQPEHDLLEAAAAEFRRAGYRTYLDPDGTDFFDLVVRRGDEVGLVEGKAAAPGAVVRQALQRRPWADWVSVLLGSERGARRLAARTTGRRAQVVGIWAYADGRLIEVRPPPRYPVDAPSDPYADLRERFRRWLDDLDRGVVPAGARWSGLGTEVRRVSGGRRFGEWRLDEVATSER